MVDELHLLQRHWRGPGLPLLMIPVSQASYQRHPDSYRDLSKQLLSGSIETIPVQFKPLNQLLEQAQWVELTDQGTAPTAAVHSTKQLLRNATDLRDLTAAEEQELDDTPLEMLSERLWNSVLLHEQAEVLELLQRRLGLHGIQRTPEDRPCLLYTSPSPRDSV